MIERSVFDFLAVLSNVRASSDDPASSDLRWYRPDLRHQRRDDTTCTSCHDRLLAGGIADFGCEKQFLPVAFLGDAIILNIEFSTGLLRIRPGNPKTDLAEFLNWHVLCVDIAADHILYASLITSCLRHSVQFGSIVFSELQQDRNRHCQSSNVQG